MTRRFQFRWSKKFVSQQESTAVLSNKASNCLLHLLPGRSLGSNQGHPAVGTDGNDEEFAQEAVKQLPSVMLSGEMAAF
jgi:hypothetical protein